MLKSINEKRKKLLRARILADLKRIKPKNALDNGSGDKGSWDHEKTKEIKVTKTDILFGDNSENLKFKNNSFDCVIFAGVLQYLENPIRALEECNRVLKKSGHIIFSTINSNSLINAFSGFKAETSTFTPLGIKKILESQGFKILNMDLIDFSFVPRRRRMIIYIIAKKVK